ncbi:MAG: hypothetical protein JNM10_07035 [Planctomycetia bacterium]|nr:hypothetical protein [Planctomycetia bacterium]
MARSLVLRIAVGAVLACGVAARTTRADVAVPGTAPVRATATIEWGPLAARLARPVVARADDTWEAVATREAGDAAWAPTVRALNGGGERPAADARVFVPPRGAPAGGATDGTAAWYVAFLDASKYGRDSDVSTTGLRPLDPAARDLSVFGMVTVALLPQRTLDDATRAAALPRARKKEVFAAKGADALVVAAPFEVATSVPEASPVRRIAHTWRCEGIDGTELKLVQASVASFDAQDRLLTATDLAGAGLRTEVWAGLAAITVLCVVMLAAARRRRRAAAGHE